MGRRQFRDLVRLNEEQRQMLLDRIDHVAQHESSGMLNSGANAREHTRYEYRRPSVPIAVEHVGGGFATLLVVTRNISTGGIAFVNGGYLHNGTRVKVVLNQVDGARLCVDGRVVSSRHLQGALHEVSVCFNRRIDISHLMSAEESRRAVMHDRLKRPHTPCDVLLLHPDRDEAITLSERMMGTAVRIEHVSTPGAAIDGVKQTRFGFIMMTLDLGADEPAAVIADLRRAGFTGSIIALYNMQGESRLQAARDAGATHLLNADCELRDLFDVVAEVVKAVDPELLTSHPGSDQEDDDAMPEHPASAYVKKVREISRSLEEAIEATSADGIAALCEQLRAGAAQHGYTELATRARSTLAAVEKQGVMKDTADAVRKLAAMCATLKPR